jgi:hypothetical protein
MDNNIWNCDSYNFIQFLERPQRTVWNALNVSFSLGRLVLNIGLVAVCTVCSFTHAYSLILLSLHLKTVDLWKECPTYKIRVS